MEIRDLETLFLDELRDAYDFEHQIVDALQEMETAASHDGLKKAFREHREQTERQVRRLEKVFRGLDSEPERQTCQGIEGILAEGREIVEADGEAAAIDAALIAAAQRVEHYEMAAYGTLSTFARQLGYDEAADLLAETLDEEEDTDMLLSRIAEEEVNRQARGGNGDSSRREGSASDRTKKELYEEARELEIEGRSRMDKEELAEEVERRH